MMDQASRELDNLVREFWSGGASLDSAQPVLEEALSAPPTNLFVGARAAAVLDIVRDKLPASISGRVVQFAGQLEALAARRAQIDKMGDLANPAQVIFEVLGEAVEHVALESFDAAALQAARVGKHDRADAARSMLEAFGLEVLPAEVVDELRSAWSELSDRAHAFQAHGLFVHQDRGLVLGLKLARDQAAVVSSFAEATGEMNKQAELALSPFLSGGGARWQIEWPVSYEGESIGLGLCVAGLVATGELPPDPLLAASGRVDVHQNVCGVGGVRAKLASAKASGIRRVLLAAEDRDEAEAADVSDSIELIYVERTSEVRNRLLNAMPKAALSYEGLIRGVRNLVPVEHLAVDDERELAHFYRFQVGDARGKVPIDVYRNGTIVVGGQGPVKEAATRVRDHVLPTKPEPRAQRTVVIPSDDRRVRLHDLVADLGAEELPPTNQYELWRFRLSRGQSVASVILYTSHKCHLPAGQAPAWDDLWGCVAKAMEGLGGLDEPVAAPAAAVSKGRINEAEPHIGTDEAGKGDYFGPLVSAAVYVDARLAVSLRDIGVKDSKLLSDKTVGTMAEEIRRIVGRRCKVTSIAPRKFNDLYRQMKSEGKNLNTLLAWGHTRSIEDLIGRGIRPRFAVVDQFADASYIERKLLQDTRDSGIQILQFPKAESDVAVAAASILARDSFLTWLDTESKRLGFKLPKGASQQVIDAARDLVARLGSEALADYAKINFKTTEKVLVA